MAIVLCAATAVPARAAAIIDFTSGVAAGGTVSYAGGPGALVGSQIPITSLFGVGTPLNSGVPLTITGGLLNFNTGDASNTGGYNWIGTATNDFFTITGGIASLGLGAGSILLNGSFLGGTASLQNLNTIALTLGSDLKNTAILEFYGLTAGTPFQFSGSTHLAPPPTSGPFSSTTFSTDIQNTAVPEPATLLLFGTGLLAVSRRSMKKSQR